MTLQHNVRCFRPGATGSVAIIALMAESKNDYFVLFVVLFVVCGKQSMSVSKGGIDTSYILQ